MTDLTLTHRLLISVLPLSLGLSLAAPALAQSTETFTVNSPIQKLTGPIFDTIHAAGQPPNNQGVLTRAQLTSLIAAINGAMAEQPVPPKSPARTVIVHYLKWNNADHNEVAFQKWYVVDPSLGKSSIYLESEADSLQRTVISGQKNFRLIYVHLDADLTVSVESFLTTAAAAGGTQTKLKVPISYNIKITKQNTQLAQDIQTLAQILGGGGAVAAAAAAPELGYYSAFDFNSNFSTSSINISAALPNSTDKTTNANSTAAKNAAGSTPNGGTAANALATQAFTNERPAYVGLGVAVPLNSYRDLTYDQSGSTLTPKTVTRQNVYVTANLYLPPSAPGLMAVRWIPHPFFGLPIKGQPLRNMAAGLAFGLKWAEPFAGIVFDDQAQVSGTTTQNRWVRKGIFGLNISVSALKTALSSSSNKSTTTTK